MREVITVNGTNFQQYSDAAPVLVGFISLKHLYFTEIIRQQRAFRTDPVHHWMFQRDFDYYETMLFDAVINKVGINKGQVRVGKKTYRIYKMDQLQIIFSGG